MSTNFTFSKKTELDSCVEKIKSGYYPEEMLKYKKLIAEQEMEFQKYTEEQILKHYDPNQPLVDLIHQQQKIIDQQMNQIKQLQDMVSFLIKSKIK